MNRITCEEVLSKLYAYLDHEVDGPTEAEIDAHLHECRECFGRADFEKRLRRRVSDTASVETPTDVRDRLESLIKRF